MNFEYCIFSVAQKLTELQIFSSEPAVYCCQLIFISETVDFGRSCRSLVLLYHKRGSFISWWFSKKESQLSKREEAGTNHIIKNWKCRIVDHFVLFQSTWVILNLLNIYDSIRVFEPQSTCHYFSKLTNSWWQLQLWPDINNKYTLCLDTKFYIYKVFIFSVFIIFVKVLIDRY